MTSFNQFYDDLRTIDYGLLCIDLYILAELPVIHPPFTSQAEKTEWSSGHEVGSWDDHSAAIARLKEIAEMPVQGLQWTTPVIDEVALQTVTADWDKATWVKYPGSDFTYGRYVFDSFDNKWVDEQPGLTKIAGARGDLMALPKDQVQTHLNLIIDLAKRLTDSSDAFWDSIGEERKFDYEPHWWSLRHFKAFHRHISRDFISINYPPFEREDKIYFGREFLRRYDLLVYKKVELIAYFVSEVRAVMGKAVAVGGGGEPKDQKLVDYFEHESKYITIMNLLVENKLCTPDTHIWVDTKSGYKSIIVRLIRHLHAMGFYKKNKMPSGEEMVLIAKNTFSVDLKYDITKSRHSSPSISDFKYIKSAESYS